MLWYILFLLNFLSCTSGICLKRLYKLYLMIHIWILTPISRPGMSIWCMLLDRPQQKFVLIMLPLEYFTEISNGTMEAEEEEVQPSSAITTLVSKTSDTWINVGYWLGTWDPFLLTHCLFSLAAQETSLVYYTASENRGLTGLFRPKVGICSFGVSTLVYLAQFCQRIVYRHSRKLTSYRFKSVSKRQFTPSAHTP